MGKNMMNRPTFNSAMIKAKMGSIKTMISRMQMSTTITTPSTGLQTKMKRIKRTSRFYRPKLA